MLLIPYLLWHLLPAASLAWQTWANHSLDVCAMGLHNRPLTLRLRESTGHCFPQETQGNTWLLSAASHFHYQQLLLAFFASCFLSPQRKFPLLHTVTESYYICDAGRPPHYLVRTQVLLILHRNQTHISKIIHHFMSWQLTGVYWAHLLSFSALYPDPLVWPLQQH